MERLRELRAKKNLVQKEVAKALKIDRTTYAKYETGDSEPSYEILKRIARFYEVSTDYLLEFDLEQEQKKNNATAQIGLKEDEWFIIDGYRSLNEQGQEYIRQTISVLTGKAIYKNMHDIPGLEYDDAKAAE